MRIPENKAGLFLSHGLVLDSRPFIAWKYKPEYIPVRNLKSWKSLVLQVADMFFNARARHYDAQARKAAQVSFVHSLPFPDLVQDKIRELLLQD